MISNVLIRSENTSTNLNRLWHEMDSDSDGVVTEKEFVESMQKNEAMRRESAERVFAEMDSDQSSSLSFSEFVTASTD